MIEGLVEFFTGEFHDSNNNGHFDGGDIQVEPGSVEAKKVWKQISIEAHSPENISKAKQLHPNATGLYMGKPLVPGVAGPGQADFQFMVDKLIYHDGYSPEVANKIAGKIASGLR